MCTWWQICVSISFTWFHIKQIKILKTLCRQTFPEKNQGKQKPLTFLKGEKTQLGTFFSPNISGKNVFWKEMCVLISSSLCVWMQDPPVRQHVHVFRRPWGDQTNLQSRRDGWRRSGAAQPVDRRHRFLRGRIPEFFQSKCTDDCVLLLQGWAQSWWESEYSCTSSTHLLMLSRVFKCKFKWYTCCPAPYLYSLFFSRLLSWLCLTLRAVLSWIRSMRTCSVCITLRRSSNSTPQWRNLVAGEVFYLETFRTHSLF